jgi:hypothetical protein
MNNTTMPVYQVKSDDDICFKTIFSEVKVGESYIVRYDDGQEFMCKRIDDWDVFIPADKNYPDCYVSVNEKYQWRSSS